MKTITIEGKGYKVECNALTYVQYKKMFGRGIIEDFQIVKNYLVNQTIETNKIILEDKTLSEVEVSNKLSEIMVHSVDDFIEVITKMAYIMIYSANNRIESYEDWLKNIKKFKIDDDWIVEVAELAVDCFC